MIKLSILLPVYNVAQYLEECLDSLLDQDLNEDEYEVICLNDGSTDNSLEILNEYAKKHPNVVVESHENAGVSVTRNIGMKMARGEYFWFVDSDDFIRPKVVGKIYNCLKENNLDQVFINIERCSVDTDSKTYFNDREPFDCSDLKIINSLEEKNKIIQRAWSAVSFIRTKLVQDNDICFVPNATMAEEPPFNYFLDRVVKTRGILSKPIYGYRVFRQGSVTNSYYLNDDQTKRYINSRICLANFYNIKIKEYKKDKKVKKDLKKMRLFDVQGALSLAVSIGDTAYTKQIIKTLQQKDLYRYNSLVNLKPQKSLRKTLINFVAIGYSFKWYLLLLTKIFKAKKKK